MPAHLRFAVILSFLYYLAVRKHVNGMLETRVINVEDNAGVKASVLGKNVLGIVTGLIPVTVPKK